MAKPKSYAAEAVIELPTVLLLRGELLGLLKQAAIGGVSVHVALPNFTWSAIDQEFKPTLHRRARVDWLEWFATKEADEDPGFPFGRVAEWDSKRNITEFSAWRLLVLPKERLSRSEARKFHDASDSWVERLGTWVEVVARTDLRQGIIEIETIGKSAYVWLGRGKNGERLRGRQEWTLRPEKPLAIGKWQWGKLLTRVSEGSDPPDAHVFVRDARHAVKDGRHRRSVLDSATATELSLSKLRDDFLEPNDPQIAQHLRNHVKEINGLTGFLKAVNVDLPTRIQQDVGEPRNMAIHRGYEPDSATAYGALSKAEEVVDRAFPWKSLL